MNKMLKKTYSIFIYYKNRWELKKQEKRADVLFPFGKPYPCLSDRFMSSGVASGQYFHQDLLVARIIHERNPLRHIDVGSRVDGFVAHVASFRSIEVFDIRPAASNIHNIKFNKFDIMKPVAPEYIACCDSLSCLHALEHFGLGRYGDKVSYDGYLTGFNHLSQMLKPDGVLYLSVPIGPQRVEFDAHRVFSLSTLLNMFNDFFAVTSFSYVDDLGDFHGNIPLDDESCRLNYNCDYGCGIFELRKK